MPSNKKKEERWQVLLDANGIVGPDGQPVSFTTSVKQTPDKRQATVVFESARSYSQVPHSVAKAIYGHLPGARLTEGSKIWTLPCTAEVNVTFKFGGHTFPIHPLDANVVMEHKNGTKYCAGGVSGVP